MYIYLFIINQSTFICTSHPLCWFNFADFSTNQKRENPHLCEEIKKTLNVNYLKLLLFKHIMKQHIYNSIFNKLNYFKK